MHTVCYTMRVTKMEKACFFPQGIYKLVEGDDRNLGKDNKLKRSEQASNMEVHCRGHGNLKEGRTWTSRASRKEGLAEPRKLGRP